MVHEGGVVCEESGSAWVRVRNGEEAQATPVYRNEEPQFPCIGPVPAEIHVITFIRYMSLKLIAPIELN